MFQHTLGNTIAEQKRLLLWHQIETPIPQRHSKEPPMLLGYRGRVFNSPLDTNVSTLQKNGPSFVTKRGNTPVAHGYIHTWENVTDSAIVEPTTLDTAAA